MQSINEELMQGTKGKIMRAAYREFEAHGYEHASTNRIVKEAGVSKGTLFNYFGSKENLYNTCIEYAVKRTVTETDNLLYKTTGFIERMYEIMQFKQNFSMKHPELTQFLTQAYLERSLPQKYQKEMDDFGERSMGDLFKDVDLSKLRDDLPEDKMMDLIRWTLDGYSEQIKNMWHMGLIELDNLEPHYDLFEEHLEVMKKLYYKE